MGRARRLAGSRRVRIGVNAVFMTGALAAAALTVMHFVHSGWPLANADPVLVSAAGILFLFPPTPSRPGASPLSNSHRHTSRTETRHLVFNDYIAV